MPTKRDFIKLTGGSAIALLVGTAAAEHADPGEFSNVALLIGPEDSQPDPSDRFFNNKSEYHYIYMSTDSGARHEITTGDTQWSQLHTDLVQYAQGELPTDVTDGALLFDTNRGLPAWWDTDHYEWPNFVDDVLTSGQTVSDTTTRIEVWNPDINANSLIKGRCYQVDLTGKFSTANTSDQFTVYVDIGGNDVTSLQNSQANVSGAPWSVEVTFTVREHGTTGSIQPHAKGIFDSITKDEHNDPVTVDTTTPTNLSVDLEWSAADVGNTVTLGQAHLKQMA